MQVTVNAVPVVNQPPTANAGVNQTITLPTNSVSSLNGGGTDPDGTITAYLWRKISGSTNWNYHTNSNCRYFRNRIVARCFINLKLKVTDNSGADLDTMQVTVNPAPVVNQLPTANAGINQTITLPTNSVSLNGGGTRSWRNHHCYLWRKNCWAGKWNYHKLNGCYNNCNRIITGTYTFELKSNWTTAALYLDTMQVTVNAAPVVNQLPAANAGVNQTITLPTNSVSLNGGGTDPDGTITAYLWRKISGPASGNITNITAATTTVTGLSQGCLSIWIESNWQQWRFRSWYHAGYCKCSTCGQSTANCQCRTWSEHHASPKHCVSEWKLEHIQMEPSLLISGEKFQDRPVETLQTQMLLQQP